MSLCECSTGTQRSWLHTWSLVPGPWSLHGLSKALSSRNTGVMLYTHLHESLQAQCRE